MVGGSRIRQIGWALVLAVCFALLLALTFKVNAVKSDVRLAERQIIAAQQAKRAWAKRWMEKVKLAGMAQHSQVDPAV